MNTHEFKTLIGQQASDLAHDIAHVERVVSNAVTIAKAEQANIKIVTAAAWLHDCVSLAKNHPQRPLASLYSADRAIALLADYDYSAAELAAIHHAISAHSYSANLEARTLEACIVQDADRLDALGAIGLVRCIQVNTELKRPFFDSNDPFFDHRALDDSRFGLDHIEQKLLKLEQRMNTATAKTMAKQRSQFLVDFMSQLRREICS
ncbi:HD domain-containing protein [Shewanella sp. NIFS-20-20]|uniref:HD domain-containing protein n=1 Tax=Shewanella sp. NIFS-20-20 TaxID=2853806 RepID=UPI001C48BFB7|nr:HD domain-containing protein [Shewanella sp. NIFS-20-20]MBV7315225.1 HD domain-containing protein [Shewanella sp. NIFS-20-20]